MFETLHFDVCSMKNVYCHQIDSFECNKTSEIGTSNGRIRQRQYFLEN